MSQTKIRLGKNCGNTEIDSQHNNTCKNFKNNFHKCSRIRSLVVQDPTWIPTEMVADPLVAKMEKPDSNQSPKAKKDKKKKLKQKSESQNENVEKSVTKDDKPKDDVFDVSALRQELMSENAFISKALSLVRVPKHKNQEQGEPEICCRPVRIYF